MHAKEAKASLRYLSPMLVLLVLGVGVISASVAAWTIERSDGEGESAGLVPLDGLDHPFDSAQRGPVFNSGPAGVLLVDRSHGQNFDIHTFVDTLESQGWSVHDIVEGPVEYDVLQSCDVFMVPVRTTDIGIDPFTDKEIEAVLHYLEGGGGLWLFHEYDGNPEGVNSLASTLGVEYRYTTVLDPVDYYYVTSWPYIRVLPGHPLGEDVDVYRHMAGCGMVVYQPAKVVATGGEHATANGCPSPPPVLASQCAKGRVVFSCDMTPLHAGYFPDRLTLDEVRLLENIIVWLHSSDTVPANGETWSGFKSQFLPRNGG